MLSIKNNLVNEIIIKKSRFITFLFRVDNDDDVKKYMNILNNDYKDATHICYAYILDNVKRFSDDGEPGGTAGMPILSVIENKNLNHILCCVVRYFGGIKLGASGLVRAYSNSCNDAIDKASIINLLPGKLCNFTFNYDNTKIIDNILKNSIITNKVYDSSVSYTFKIQLDDLSCVDSELNKYGCLTLISDCFIEK